MKYRIMIKTATGNKDQYQFLTFINVNSETEIWETDSLVELDKQVEKMLNGNYRKSDILLVSPLSFDVFADVYDNSKYPPEPTPEPTPEPEPDPTPEPEKETESEGEPSVTNISYSVIAEGESSNPESSNTPSTPIVNSVVFEAVGENLPEDVEYVWSIVTSEGTITKTSTGKTLTVEDDDKDALASPISATVTIGNYTSDLPQSCLMLIMIALASY